MEDREIVALYWAREERAIRESERKYGRYCRRVAAGVLGDREDCEECVSDTWLAAWNAMPPHRPEKLAAFLGRLTRNLALNRWSSRSAEKRGGGQTALALEELAECLPAPNQVERQVEDMELARAINRFLAGLAPEPRRLFVRRYWYMASIREIADAYALGESKVKMSLSRTRKKLRKFLEEEGIDL